MKFFTIIFVAICALLACAEEDGKYRPEAATTVAAVIPTTTRPLNKWNDPRFGQPGWNTWNQQNPAWNNQGWNNPNWNTWNRVNATQPAGRNDWRWRDGNRWDTRYNVNAAGRPANRFNDWRTVHLDEIVDARGYQYDYETVGGVKVLETGTFENIGLRQEGVRAVGSIVITDREGVIYKINYQSESKEPYVAIGAREPERIPPTLVRALALLESHK